MAVVLDTHVVHWWSSEPERLSEDAQRAIADADELVVASITWFELAWLGHHERILISIPVRRWLEQLQQSVRTAVLTPAIADTAVSLGSSFPGDPADRVIYATAIECGLDLVTKDGRMRDHDAARPVTIW